MSEWIEGLPESVRDWDEVKNSDSPDKFWDQMTHMRSRLGRSLTIPNEDAGEDEWKQFNEKLVTKVPTLIKRPDPEDQEGMQLLYKAMGHPESVDQYKDPEFDTQVKLDMTPVQQFKPIAHKYGLTQKQYEGIVKEMTMMNIDGATERQKTHTEAMQSLRVDWGLKYDTNIEKAKQIAKVTNAPKALADSLEIGTASRDTLVWLVEMADRIGGEKLNLANDKTTNPDIMTPSEARERLNSILRDRTNPYWIKDHPENANMIKKVFTLQKMANPGASTSLNDLRAGGGQPINDFGA